MRAFSALLLTLLLAAAANAGEVDPELQAKADAYQAWLEEWHSSGLGGLTTAVTFADPSYQEVACLHYQGDSMIWTGSYLAGEAARYAVTGDPAAKAEAVRIAKYLHDAMDITDTLGYIARYAGPDQFPWNCGVGDDNDWKVHGVGEWEGYYWIDHTSRDQYSGWWLGLSTAYDLVDDEAMRATIRQDMADVIEMLVTNDWHITDENGEWTGNNAHWVGPLMRLSWLVQAAHVIDEPYYWDLVDRQYALLLPVMGIDTDAFLNRYSEYFGNNLRHNAFLPIFRFWPDKRRLNVLYDIWMKHNRRWVADTYNPWFDAVHVAGCLRLGRCDAAEMEDIRADTVLTLRQYWDVPDYQRAITCSVMPLDPFSVWMDDLLDKYPALREIIDVHPQAKDARQLPDRHWTDMYWQSTPFEAGCNHGANPNFVGAGFDYLVAYWMGVYYGLLPGDGPYGDDEFEGDAPAADGGADDDAPAGAADDDVFDTGDASADDDSGCAS
jgi:hypothetical protein